MYTALRTFCPLRPTRFDCEAMTFPEMTVRAMDEILLRTEISGRGEEGDSARDVQTGPAWVRPRQARPSRSGRGEEGFSARRPNGPGVGTAATSAALPLRKRGRRVTQRATSKRARRGYGRDKRGPPHSKKNRDKGVNGEWAAFWRLA